MDVHDIVGVGFGPANLAVAVAAHELADHPKVLFTERQPTFRWHGGMLLDGAAMQSSFLKDVVSLRNPTSGFSFLAYLKEKGRLEQFASLGTLYPSRLEFNDYMSWVAARFTDSVAYSTEVDSIEPVPGDGVFRVGMVDRRDGSRREVLGRNVVVGVGGRPLLPPGVSLSDRVIHSSNFLPGLAAACPDVADRHVLAVVGGGQSAGEIACHLLSAYATSEVHLIMRTSGPQRLDDNPFVNDHFTTESSRRFYHLGERRNGELARLKTGNYGVMSDELLERLYASEYDGRVHGWPRLVVHRDSEVLELRESGDQVLASLSNRDGSQSAASYDLVVLGTGYERSFDRLAMMRGLGPALRRDPAGKALISPTHRLRLREPMPGGVYMLGYHESDFGFGDSLLSHIALRAETIVTDVRDPQPDEEQAADAVLTPRDAE